MGILEYNDQTRLELEPAFVRGLNEALSHSRALYSSCAVFKGKFRTLAALELPSTETEALARACEKQAERKGLRLGPRISALSSASPDFTFGEAAAALVRQYGRGYSDSGERVIQSFAALGLSRDSPALVQRFVLGDHFVQARLVVQ